MTVPQIYAPTVDAEEEEMDEFYSRVKLNAKSTEHARKMCDFWVDTGIQS